MSRAAVHEAAMQLNMDEKGVASAFLIPWHDGRESHLSVVDSDAVKRVKRHLVKKNDTEIVEERIRPTVVKRRGRKRSTSSSATRTAGTAADDASKATPVAAKAEPVAKPTPEPAAAPKAKPVAEAKAGPAASAPAKPAPATPASAPAEAEKPVAKAPEPPPAEVKAEPAPAPAPKADQQPASAEPAPEQAAALEGKAPEARPATPPPAPVRAMPARPNRVAPAPRASQPPPAGDVRGAPRGGRGPGYGRGGYSGRVPQTTVVENRSSSGSSAPGGSRAAATTTAGGSRPSAPPRTGIEVWGGRPGVPMPKPPIPRSPVARRVEYNPRANQGGRSGGGRNMRNRHHRRQGNRPRGPVNVSTKEMSSEKKVIKIEESINVQALAAKMSIKATELLMKIMGLGLQGAHINSQLDADTAKIIASEFGWEVEDVAVSEEEQLVAAQGAIGADDEHELEPRPPIVTVMGHVDHGKTSLLDYLRKSNVAAGEAGGITQHVGAYRVVTDQGPITFLDTPGHAAFTQMRARGANLTDLCILIVSADDGVMPQTREAANHAKAAKIPIIVAINKIDKPDANPDKVKRGLMELELIPEELGGDTLFCEISAKTGQGIPALLDAISLQSEMIEDLRANPKRAAHGVVVEALLDRGKGPVARIIITDGTLRTGDHVLVGPAFGKVRAMTDEHGKKVASAGPSTPVELLGLSDVPNAGDAIDAVKDVKKAQAIAQTRKAKAKTTVFSAPKVTLEDLAMLVNQEGPKELRLVLKADVQGSVEAVQDALNKLTCEKAKVTIVNASVGAITEGDVNLAIAAKAIIIGFNTKPAGKARSLAEKEGIEIRQYSIIYNAVDDVRSAMEGLLPPTLVEKALGKAEVRMVFKLTKAGVVAGSMVIESLVRRHALARIRREGEIIYDGKIDTLKRFKDDVKEVKEGFECGIGLDGFDKIREGDIIEAYEIEEIRTKLS